jgi:hypothetical protein
MLGALTLLQKPVSYAATDLVPIKSIGYDLNAVEEDSTICCKENKKLKFAHRRAL